MRVSDRTKPGAPGRRLGCLVAVISALLAGGCSTTIDGTPTAGPGAGPTEPSFPTPRPAPSRPPRPSAPPSAPAPAKATPLPANDNGYVFIETKSGKTRCQISAASVGCEAQFTNSPLRDGQHANGVSVSADGTVEWILGNLGNIPVVTIDYRTYTAQGWTIVAAIDGTRFTNAETGHGMFVSIDKVETF